MRIPRQTFEALESGEYACRVLAVVEQEGQYGPQLRVAFELDGEHAGRQIFGWCTPSFTPKAKLTRWGRALLGPELDVMHELDTAALVGRECRLILTVATAGDGSERNKIVEVLPPRQAGRQVPPAIAQPAPAAAPGRSFAGPAEAIQWGFEAGGFASAAAAAAAYNDCKGRVRPGAAAEMWAAWVQHVEALVAARV